MEPDFKPARESLKKLTVLYVEDDSVTAMPVVHFLKQHVGRLIEAKDGEEAWGAFLSEAPDLVLTDIQMPLMSGLELTEKIKTVSRETPVVITTAHNQPDFLQRAIACGVDGYVLKPVDPAQMMMVILRAVQQLMNHRELVSSRAVLVEYHRRAEKERTLVATLMSRMMRVERLADPLVHYWIQPTEVVGGDLIGVARSPHGKLYFMLADSTDHGLASTMNLLPINHIFYSMVSKNQPVALIVEEMNWAVRDQSPIERYVAMVVGCMDANNRLVEVWNGGIPDAIFVGKSGEILARFPSENLPLGVIGKNFSAQTRVYQADAEGQLLVYSDGVSDAENRAGDPFDSERVEAVIRENPPEARLASLKSAVQDHVGDRHVSDDMAVLMISSHPLAAVSC